MRSDEIDTVWIHDDQKRLLVRFTDGYSEVWERSEQPVPTETTPHDWTEL